MSVIAGTAGLLIVFNVLMWFIFLHKFNTFFSTRKIIEETRDAINEKIREANNAAERNMNLINGKIQELNKVKAEADRRLAVLKRELETQKREKEFRDAIAASAPSSKKHSAYGAKKTQPVQAELAFTEKARVELGIGENVLPQTVYGQPVLASSAYINSSSAEKNEFFENRESSGMNNANASADSGERADNNINGGNLEIHETLQKIPVINNSIVYRTEDQIVPKKDFSQQVRELYVSGIPVEEIARQTGRSEQEVRLVIQML